MCLWGGFWDKIGPMHARKQSGVGGDGKPVECPVGPDLLVKKLVAEVPTGLWLDVDNWGLVDELARGLCGEEGQVYLFGNRREGGSILMVGVVDGAGKVDRKSWGGLKAESRVRDLRDEWRKAWRDRAGLDLGRRDNEWSRELDRELFVALRKAVDSGWEKWVGKDGYLGVGVWDEVGVIEVGQRVTTTRWEGLFHLVRSVGITEIFRRRYPGLAGPEYRRGWSGFRREFLARWGKFWGATGAEEGGEVGGGVGQPELGFGLANIGSGPRIKTLVREVGDDVSALAKLEKRIAAWEEDLRVWLGGGSPSGSDLGAFLSAVGLKVEAVGGKHGLSGQVSRDRVPQVLALGGLGDLDRKPNLRSRVDTLLEHALVRSGAVCLGGVRSESGLGVIGDLGERARATAVRSLARGRVGMTVRYGADAAWPRRGDLRPDLWADWEPVKLPEGARSGLAQVGWEQVKWLSVLEGLAAGYLDAVGLGLGGFGREVPGSGALAPGRFWDGVGEGPVEPWRVEILREALLAAKTWALAELVGGVGGDGGLGHRFGLGPSLRLGCRRTLRLLTGRLRMTLGPIVEFRRERGGAYSLWRGQGLSSEQLKLARADLNKVFKFVHLDYLLQADGLVKGKTAGLLRGDGTLFGMGYPDEEQLMRGGSFFPAGNNWELKFGEAGGSLLPELEEFEHARLFRLWGWIFEGGGGRLAGLLGAAKLLRKGVSEGALRVLLPLPGPDISEGQWLLDRGLEVWDQVSLFRCQGNADEKVRKSLGGVAARDIAYDPVGWRAGGVVLGAELRRLWRTVAQWPLLFSVVGYPYCSSDEWTALVVRTQVALSRGLDPFTLKPVVSGEATEEGRWRHGVWSPLRARVGQVGCNPLVSGTAFAGWDLLLP